MPTHAKVERWVVLGNRAVIVAMMAAMVALVFANVVARYGFNYSIIWAEELSQYLMVWIAYLGAGLALREGRHVSVDILQNAVPSPLRAALRWLITLAVGAFMAAVAWLGFEFAAFTWIQETPVMQIPLGLVYLAVPLGAVLFLLHLLLFLRPFAAGRFDEPEPLEAEERA